MKYRMREKKTYDAVIIGGGPAGSSAAIFLSDKNIKVCVVEKKKFPRETLCGEFLSREVITQLKEWGIFEEFLLMNPNPVNAFMFVNNDGNILRSDLNFNAYGLSRFKFDNFILNKAKDKADVFTETKVLSVVPGKYVYKLKIISEGSITEIESKLVIAAYGRQNILDRQLGRKFVNFRSGYTGIKFHADISQFNNFKENEIYIFAGNSIYCGMNKVNDGMVTVCYLENKNKYPGKPEHHLTELASSNPGFANIISGRLLENLKNCTFFGAGNIYFGEKEPVKNGIFMIGDAAGVIAPLAGDGIGVAFESAEILSKVLFRLIKGMINKKEAEAEYAGEWQENFKKRFTVSKIVQKGVLRNFTRENALRLIRLYPGIAGKLIELTRG